MTVQELFDLRGQVAIITGGGRGLGFARAEALASRLVLGGNTRTLAAGAPLAFSDGWYSASNSRTSSRTASSESRSSYRSVLAPMTGSRPSGHTTVHWVSAIGRAPPVTTRDGPTNVQSRALPMGLSQRHDRRPYGVLCRRQMLGSVGIRRSPQVLQNNRGEGVTVGILPLAKR